MWNSTSRQTCIWLGFNLYTGNIWIPIVLHGLSDFPFMFMTQSETVANGHAPTDWVGLGVDVVLFIGIGSFLIYNSQVHARKAARRLSLTQLSVVGVTF